MTGAGIHRTEPHDSARHPSVLPSPASGNTGDGTGYGPPAECPVERVVDDVDNGLVSPDAATDIYRVSPDEGWPASPAK